MFYSPHSAHDRDFYQSKEPQKNSQVASQQQLWKGQRDVTGNILSNRQAGHKLRHDEYDRLDEAGRSRTEHRELNCK